jgi:hypothetical protein
MTGIAHKISEKTLKEAKNQNQALYPMTRLDIKRISPGEAILQVAEQE